MQSKISTDISECKRILREWVDNLHGRARIKIKINDFQIRFRNILKGKTEIIHTVVHTAILEAIESSGIFKVI